MRKKIFVAIIFQMLFPFCKSNAQVDKKGNCKQEFDTLSNSFVYSQVDAMPIYDNKEGVAGYFLQHLKISNEDDFQGSIKLVLIIDTAGNITSARIRNKENGKLSVMEKEAISVAQSMPKWSVGKCNGKAVSVKVNLNIVF